MVQLILTSFAKKSDALKFAGELVSTHLAACCTILPGATSVFEWKGKRETAGEVLLLIKTISKNLPALKKFFNTRHPYELPEFLILNAKAGARYAKWIRTSCLS